MGSERSSAAERRQCPEGCINSQERATFLRGVEVDHEPSGMTGQAAWDIYHFPP